MVPEGEQALLCRDGEMRIGEANEEQGSYAVLLVRLHEELLQAMLEEAYEREVENEVVEPANQIQRGRISWIKRYAQLCF